MRTILSLIVIVLYANLSFSQDTKIVSTGAGYVDEVYFSFENGSVKTGARSAWDIAFTTETFDVSVLVNNGNTDTLFTYPDGDISDWNSVDITGINSWTPMYNSIDSWYGGAFVMNSTGHPDYGWGVYNDVTHFITGDSIFILKLASGVYKKLVIVEKNAGINTWEFKYANIDGSDEVIVNFDADDYSNLNFIHYSIENQAFVEQEPNMETWQLLFTRYADYTIPYIVSGVLSKDGVYVQEVKETGLDQATYYDYDLGLFSDVISTIGSDWKAYYFKGWEVADTVVYFVQDSSIVDKSIWKLYFTDFGGMDNGEYTFVQENLTGADVNDLNNTFSTVYPNPANNLVNLIYDIDGDCVISIYNINGQLIYSEAVSHNEHLNKHQIDVENLSSGLYTVTIRAGTKFSSSKFIKK